MVVLAAFCGYEDNIGSAEQQSLSLDGFFFWDVLEYLGTCLKASTWTVSPNIRLSWSWTNVQ